jgi:hypothetical protein
MRGRQVFELEIVRVIAQIHYLSYHNIVLIQNSILDGDTVLSDTMVRCILVPTGYLLTRLRETLLPPRCYIPVLLILVHGIIQSTEKSTLQGVPIDNHTILLIVPRIACDGYNGILSIGHILHVQDIGDTRLHKRTLRGADDVGILVDTLLIVRDID